MTSDLVQNSFMTTKHDNAARLELTRDERFVNGSADIFDLLAKDKSGTLDAGTAEMLKAAYRMIEKAEHTISNQNMRIRTLESLLTTDELTGLTNRRGFFEAFRRETDRTNRGENQGGLLIMIDLDNFKTINDTHGHPAGDAALKLVGKFLANEIRDMDVAARLGGDEFIILFPNTCKEKAMKRAQTLGLRLNNLSLVWEGKEIAIGASLGLKDYKKGETIESIISDADQGLYNNKKARKRNRTN